MKELLWFCRSSDNSSLSRITDSLLPKLLDNFKITLLSNKTSLEGIRNVVLGSDCTTITYKEYLSSQKEINDKTIRAINMKYAVVQLVDLIYEGNFDWVVLCNGIYEVNWMTKMLGDSKFLTNKEGKITKLVVWSPIDSIPNKEVLQNIHRVDLFLTMTPVMADIVKDIIPEIKVNWLGHGSDISLTCTDKSTDKSIDDELNKLRSKNLIVSRKPFKSSEIIILNANNYGPLDSGTGSGSGTGTGSKSNSGTRKRLDITLKAFQQIKDPEIKLWIHTNLASFFEMLALENILLSTLVDRIILSDNKNFTSEQLSLIYQRANISIQTSWGEGWSLINMESAIYRSLQVVPDFLACGWHFGSDRGILIPVTKKTIKNEAEIEVIIGEISVNDTQLKLETALDIVINKPKKLKQILDKAETYSKQYTWTSIAERLVTLLS